MPTEKQSSERRAYMKEYYRLRPWMKPFKYAHSRCKYRSSDSYSKYGGRGIEFMLTPAETEFLWKRDEAAKLNKPSIDRIDSEKGYSLENCRFIEHSENSRRGAEHCRILTEKDVIEIRSRMRGISYTTMAMEYGVSRKTLMDVIERKTWKHIPAAVSASSRTRKIEAVDDETKAAMDRAKLELGRWDSFPNQSLQRDRELLYRALLIALDAEDANANNG